MFDYVRALHLFELTIAILLAPKVLGLSARADRRADPARLRRRLRLTISLIIEIIASAAIAPIMMLIQTGAVVQILSGRDTGWNPQRRDDGSIPFRSIARRHRSHVVMGVVALVAAGAALAFARASGCRRRSPACMLAIPISWASGQLSIGTALRRLGLLMTPEENVDAADHRARQRARRELEKSGHDDEDGLRAIATDPRAREAHEFYLPDGSRRRRGEVDVEKPPSPSQSSTRPARSTNSPAG